MTFPTHARAVIVGGGIIGCSVAYHLAKLGWKDVVLLERLKLAGGTSFHAAGLVGQLRTSASITQLLGHSVALYQELEAETGQATGWKMNGGLRLACDEARLIELKRAATTARSFGLEMHLLTPREAKALWPLMTIDDLVGAAFLPTDGQASPADITTALAIGAKKHGATIIEGCKVTGVRIERGRVAEVQTAQGSIHCEVLVNCCGQWAREFGALAGVNVPLVSVQHQYLITEPIEGVTPTLPTLRDPDRLTYWKEEVGGLVMGGYEPDPLPWDAHRGPARAFKLLEPDWNHFQQIVDLATVRVPALETAGIRQLLNGAESFTPDGSFLLGEAPEVGNYFVAAGFNAFGIAAAGGAGKALAEWIAAGEPPYDLWPVDIRRFGLPHQDTRWVRTRAHEIYGKHYTIAWPHEEHRSGRPLRCSPLYDRLASAGACFGEKLGWERPNWFAPPGVEPKDQYSFGRQNWFAHVGEEHHAVRERVGLFDQSSFAKFMVSGPGAEAALSWICANDIRKPPGSLTYTQMLNSRGGIECDPTVARLSDDAFYIVTGTGCATHDAAWIRRHLPNDGRANFMDITSAMAVLSLMGPMAREVLGAVIDQDLSNAAFPFATCRILYVRGAPVTALRVTYVGELGWELHVPVECALTVYEALMEAGRTHGIANCGYRAIESLRLEKGYRAWGADITPSSTPLEAGLGWAVKLKKDLDFLGRDALIRQLQAPLTKALACFMIAAPEVVLLGRETVYRDGKRVGWLSSAGWGYTVNANIGYGYVRNDDGVDNAYLESGSYELEVATERVSATLHLRSLYDPDSLRVKA